MARSTRLTVAPGPPLAGRLRPPGDKSITHRAYLLALLARGASRVLEPNPGADCEGTLACVARLGARVSRSNGTVTIEGTGGVLAEPDRVLDCGNSGTTLRLLAGVLAAQPLFAVLSGDDSLRRRPVARIVEPLRRMGATLTARDSDRYPPLAIRGGALRGVDYALPVPSAQVASCTLLAGLKATGRTTVRIPGAARDHTERMLRAFGVPVEQLRESAGAVSASITGPAELLGATLTVPGDFSSAAFFLAAAAACPGANVTAEGVGLNPTRTGLLDVLEAMGAQVARTNVREQGGEPVGDVTVIGPDALAAADVPAALLPAMIDEVPAWVIAASAAHGTSRLTGAAELRVKESDRLAMLARNLAAIGIAVEESAAGLAITGGAPHGGAIEAAGDHRIAMAFAVLGTRASAPVTIDDDASVDTSFPGFAEALRKLGGRVDA